MGFLTTSEFQGSCEGSLEKAPFKVSFRCFGGLGFECLGFWGGFGGFTGFVGVLGVLGFRGLVVHGFRDLGT